MCAILTWGGELPVGLISHLLVTAQCRGRDGTGIAFRDLTKAKPQSVSFRQAYSAKTFVSLHQPELKRARQSVFGIAHTRRASSGMTIDAYNAHPFLYGKTFFIHNGLIRNWKSIDPTVSTDSILLGPILDAWTQNPTPTLDISKFIGMMGVAWLRGDSVHCFKVNQDLTSAIITWEPKKGNGGPKKVCVVASTMSIIERAMAHVELSMECQEVELNEGRIYSVTPNGPIDVGGVKVDGACYDEPGQAGLLTRLTQLDDTDDDLTKETEV